MPDDITDVVKDMAEAATDAALIAAEAEDPAQAAAEAAMDAALTRGRAELGRPVPDGADQPERFVQRDPQGARRHHGCEPAGPAGAQRAGGCRGRDVDLEGRGDRGDRLRHRGDRHHHRPARAAPRHADGRSGIAVAPTLDEARMKAPSTMAGPSHVRLTARTTCWHSPP